VNGLALTKDEQDQLDALQRKAAEPEPRNGGRSEHVDVYIDLSDEQAVKRGLDLGYLKASDLDGGDDDQDDDDGKPKRKAKAKADDDDDDVPPRRRGYFKE
jgi:hypothetical protein